MKPALTLIGAALIGCATLLSGCGQKGPLYFPEDDPKKPGASSLREGEAARDALHGSL